MDQGQNIYADGMRKILGAATLAAAALLTLSACGASAGASDVTGHWGDPKADQTPSLEFRGTEAKGEFSGTDGCNVVGGNYTVQDGVVSLGAMHSTMMFCEGVDTWLTTATEATISGDELVFSDKTGEKIGTLARADTAKP